MKTKINSKDLLQAFAMTLINSLMGALIVYICFGWVVNVFNFYLDLEMELKIEYCYLFAIGFYGLSSAMRGKKITFDDYKFMSEERFVWNSAAIILSIPIYLIMEFT